jgi:membrane associated rhomboid family serine protease
MDPEQRKIVRSLFYPAIFVIAIWLVKAIEVIFSVDLGYFGLYPQQWKGLPGILTMPFLHAGFSHLFANTFPLFILAALLFYFYRDLAWRILIMLWLVTGLWVWAFAHEGIHIGASGIIYGLASFLFFSGIIRKETGLMVITLLVTFLYGGIIWGVFPKFFPNQQNISWEGHLMGLLAGLVLAIYYRKHGPQKKEYQWDEDEDDDDDTGGLPGFDDPHDNDEIHYDYKEKP